MSADRNMLLLWFPLLLFSGEERESTQGQELEEHRIKYMNILQTYIAQQGDNQEENAKKLGNVYELMYDIQDL